MNRLAWYFKQLFPLRYVSVYTQDGNRRLDTWRMWFGRCFDIKHYQLKRSNSMTKKQRIRYDIKEAMSRNVAGANRNTAIKEVNDRYHLSTAAAGSLRAKVIFVGPPTLKWW